MGRERGEVKDALQVADQLAGEAALLGVLIRLLIRLGLGLLVLFLLQLILQATSQYRYCRARTASVWLTSLQARLYTAMSSLVHEL